MIKICIYLFIPLTSVLSYPSSSFNRNTDKYDLPNEFWSHHFGPDFKDALHFQIQQSDIINNGNNGNILHKHFPTDNRNNGHFKRSNYVLQTPQMVQTQNRTLDNFMKVQLLAPGEVEALERAINNKEMHKSPLVVTLPDFGSVGRAPNSYNHHASMSSPNTFAPPVVYQSNQNSAYSSFYQNNNHDIWPQNQQYTSSYNPKAVFQQLPRPAYEKTMQHSYEKMLMKPFQPASYENNMRTQHEQISLPSPDINIDTLLQPSFEKPVEPSTQQSFYQQHLNGQQLEEKITEPSYDKTMHQPSIDMMPASPTADTVQPSTTNKTESSTDKMQLPIDQMQPINDLITPAFKTIQPSYKKVHATFEKTPGSYPKIRNPGYDEISSSYDPEPMDKVNKQIPYEEVQHPSYHQPMDKVIKQSPYEEVQHPSYHQPMDKVIKQSPYEEVQHPSYNKDRIMPYDNPMLIDPARQSFNAENIELPYEEVQHPSYHQPMDKVIKQSPYEEVQYPSYHQAMDKVIKQSPYKEVQHPSYNKDRIMPYDNPMLIDPARQSFNAENIERTFEPKEGLLFDKIRDAKHEYHGEKKTSP